MTRLVTGKVAKMFTHESRASFLNGYGKPIPIISMLRSEKCLLSVFLLFYWEDNRGVGFSISS